jgi:branched-chain amino acid aminotransferase
MRIETQLALICTENSTGGTLLFMIATVNMNGVIVDAADAHISVFDHGFLYGDGIYETLRTYGGLPFLLDRHLQRLRTSAGMIALPIPLDDAEIGARIERTTRAAGLGRGSGREAYIRLLITRGVGELSYDPSVCPQPSVVIIVKPLSDLPDHDYEEGVMVALVSTVRNHPASVNPLVKSNNLLNSALAMQEALRRGAFEGLMRNYRGELAECSTANLFVVERGVALTPPLDAGLLAGVTRAYLFEIGPSVGVMVNEVVLRDEDLYGADEAFLTSTTREIVPIVRVDDRVIGGGHPGPVTRRLLDAYRGFAQAAR